MSVEAIMGSSKVVILKFQFEDIQKPLASHLRTVGMAFESRDSRPGALDRFVRYTCMTGLFSYETFCGLQGFYEHLFGGGGDFFSDMLTFSLMFIGIVSFFSFNHLYGHEDALREILFWCSDIYWPQNSQHLWKEVFERVHANSIKYLKYLWRVIFGYLSLLLSGAILSKVLTGDGLLMIVMYRMDGFVQEFPWYWLLVLYQLVAAGTLILHLTSTLAIFSVFSEHLGAQCDYISQLLANLDAGEASEEETGLQLDCIIELHSDVMAQIQKFADIFDFPMLLNEIAPVLCFMFIGLICFVKHSDYNQGASAVALIGIEAIYAYFGELITEKAENIANSAFCCPWPDFSISHQKKIQMIIMMGNKKRGVSSGGFHLVCYEQYSKIMSRGYNIMLFMANMFSDA